MQLLEQPKLKELAGNPQAGRVALKGFFGVAEAWELTAAEGRVLLGGIGKTAYYKYRACPEIALPRDALERISFVLGIYKALHLLFPDGAQADAWIRRANSAPPFNGQSALDRMLGGSIMDLAAVRQYLDFMRG